MAINIWIWITAAVVAIFSIAFVYLIVAFLVPAKNSPAKYFIKAKREKKPVFFMDAGKYFKCVVGEDKSGKEAAEIYRVGNDIIKGGQGMKYCEGVLMGVGEDFRSLTTNIAIVDLMEMINKKKWDPDEVVARLAEISDHLKTDLGVKDQFEDLDNARAEAQKKIENKYQEKRDAVIKKHTILERPEPDPEGDNEENRE